MKRNWENPPWYSSYEKNNYGELFYSLMRIYRPKKVVELGTKAGYSAYHIARGLRDNRKGKLDCYDLWEKYEFNTVPKSTAINNLAEFKDLVSFNERDAIEVYKKYNKIDILHVDISNDGKILENIIPYWIDKVRQVILIEGGSPERDNFHWMIKYKKEPIMSWLKGFADRGGIEYFTINPFPSITIIQKLQ